MRLFRDRRDAASKLADALRGRPFRRPLVLGIPRGGVATAAVIAEQLPAELDVTLSRKLHAPHFPEYAIGAVGEDGVVVLNPEADLASLPHGYLDRERENQLAEIARRRRMIRRVRPAATIAGRSVIVADDGLATGATMTAALQVVRKQEPYELIVAVPVAAPDRLAAVGRWCDAAVCLHAPPDFRCVGAYYDDFRTVEDEEVIGMLRARSGEVTRQ